MGGIQRYPMLQKKLEELESKLKVLLLQFPENDPDSASLPDHRQLIKDEIEGRIDFLKNLVAREMESHSDGAPDQLTSIANRLASVELSFHNWVDCRVPLDDSPGLGPDPGSDEDNDEDLSNCSCTNSCFNEGEDEERDDETRLPPAMSMPALKEDAGVQKQQETKKDMGIAEKQSGFRGRRNRCCVLSVVIVIAAVMVGAAANFGTVEEEFFLVPT